MRINRQLLPFAVAIGTTTIALLLTLLLESIIPESLAVIFFVAVMLSTLRGGWRSLLVASVLSTLLFSYFFIAPVRYWSPLGLGDLIRFSSFVAAGLVVDRWNRDLRNSKRQIEHLNQQLLDESTRQLQTALGAAQMGLWDWDLVTGKLIWSPEHEQLFGLTPGTFDGRYQTFDACLHPDDRDGLNQAVTQSHRNQMPYQHEFRAIWADGSIHWLEGRGQAFYNEVREPVRMSGTVMAIDDRKRLEFAWKQSEQQFRAIFEAEPECVKVITPDGILHNMNPAGLTMIEAENLEAVRGQNVCPLIEPAHQQAFLDFIQQAAQGKRAMLEFEIIGLKGTRRWLESHAVPLQTLDRAESLVLSVTRDTTERKQAELLLQQLNTKLEQRVADRTAELTTANDRLIESETLFRQLAENIQDVFWIADAKNQQVIYVSPAYETLWGRDREVLYQNYHEWLTAVHPDDRLRVAQTVRGAQGDYDHEYRIVRPDGSIRWIRDRASPIENEAGEVIRIAGIAEDITERQRVEEIKNEFISVVSHELRTPLMAIQMSLGLLRTGIYANKPEKTQRMIEIAAIDTNRLVNLVNDILDLERLESGRAVLERTICRADELIQQAIESISAIATQQKIAIAALPTDAIVWAAPDSIIQTLTNLLSNAIKFSPADMTVELRADRQPDSVLFQVIDRGRGIPADKLEAVFERFQQVDTSDAREKGGTGLGLPICRSIIERQGGKIWVESTFGAGSTFFFTLPIPENIDV